MRLGNGAALVMSFADTEAIQAHLAEISAAVDPFVGESIHWIDS